MDPDAALTWLLMWANSDPSDRAYDTEEAKVKFMDLHLWLVRGGFPPDLWLGVDKDH